ncbi:hypothetical protein JDV02_001752 [Purpureocillium takamizusanense]|uniref:Uncharacterized protein n=1 Tax=Purpureocillium takamizusanense TaxID=2060973 RepID=A0A9Q8Q9Y0_9HYPO|nr:uncharacterized protein JDV02_001752 [Purpureocillium takamizusanense]UNI15194.1 hypothetical protein JDV02_001752 [Purpureocillium takamizusanense]
MVISILYRRFSGIRDIPWSKRSESARPPSSMRSCCAFALILGRQNVGADLLLERLEAAPMASRSRNRLESVHERPDLVVKARSADAPNRMENRIRARRPPPRYAHDIVAVARSLQ